MLRRFLCLSFSGGSTFLFSVSEDSKSRVRKRRWWRWPLRVCIVLLLAAVGAALYLNQAGLPDFAKRSLQARLAERGVRLDFDWLRMDWNGAWRAAQLRLGQADAGGSVGVTVDGSVVRPDYGALLAGRAAVRDFSLTGLQFEAQLTDGAHGDDQRCAVLRGKLGVGDDGGVVNFRADLFRGNFDDVAHGESLRLQPAQPRLAGLARAP